VRAENLPPVSSPQERLDLLMPLYGFRSDPFQVAESLEIVRYNEEFVDDLFHKKANSEERWLLTNKQHSNAPFNSCTPKPNPLQFV